MFNGRYCKFISFADSRLHKTAVRIAAQAAEMDVFDEVEVFDESSLLPDLAPWLQKGNKRRFAFYCWKPYLVLRELQKMKDGDFLVYCDAGCHLKKSGRPRFLDYLSMLADDAIGVKLFEVAESFRGKEGIEKIWTKGDVFDYFRCRENEAVVNSLQFASGHVFCRKCDSALLLLQQWDTAWRDDFSLLTDEDSKKMNFPEFCEHRHDQSILSVAYKLAGGTPLPYGETWRGEDGWLNREMFPIWDVRDKGGNHVIHAKYILYRLISFLPLFGIQRKAADAAEKIARRFPQFRW